MSMWWCCTGSGEPLLAAEWADEQGYEEKEEDQLPEPAPGDMHYPWLERQMQKAYSRWVRCNDTHILLLITSLHWLYTEGPATAMLSESAVPATQSGPCFLPATLEWQKLT